MNKRGFTLMELLIVMTIIAILAAAIIPNFIGFDAEAKVAATKSNLDTLRSRITLFRAKEGRYPASLQELVDKSYLDAGVKRPYLKVIPLEMVSSRNGSSANVTRTSEEPLTNSGGWAYIVDTADVHVNVTNPLDKGWGEYAGQIPSEW